MRQHEVIFLFVTVALQADIEKYSLTELTDMSIKVIVADLTPVIAPETDRAISQRRMNDNSIENKVFHSYDEIRNFIKEYSDRAFFFLMFDQYYAVRKIYSYLNRYQVSYGYVNHLEPDLGVGKEGMEGYLRPKLNLSRVKSALYNRLLRKIYPCKYADLIVFGGVANEETYFKLGRCNGKTKRLYLRTFNYERYLRVNEYDNNGREYCVFLDQFFPYHPDNIVDRKWNINAEKYFEEMNRIFEYIHDTYKLEIIVAAHPRGDYTGKPYAFSGVKIEYGKTSELVKSAKLVLAHFSTSISFAVMACKPVVILCTPEVARFEEAYCREYQQKFNYPMWRGIEDDDRSYLFHIDEEKYQLFLKEYVICEKLCDTNIALWRKIADEIFEQEGESDV